MLELRDGRCVFGLVMEMRRGVFGACYSFRLRLVASGNEAIMYICSCGSSAGDRKTRHAV